jgi:hypothetical protein
MPTIPLFVYTFLIGLAIGGYSGYEFKTMSYHASEAKTLEVEAKKQEIIQQIEAKTESTTLAEEKKTEIVYQTVTKEVIKYVPKVQIINSECNLTLGTVRMLNTNIRNEMPSTPSTTIAENSTSSTITGKGSIDFTNDIINKYNKMAIQCNSLIDYNNQIVTLNKD